MQQAQKFGCGNFSIVGPVKGKPGKFGYKCLFCGSYRCNRCRNPKLKKLRSRIGMIASEKKLNKMATLTLDSKLIPEGQKSDRYIRECWRKMRVLLARKFGKSIDFFGTLEFQEHGMAHLHVLINQFIPQGWLSEAWQAIGGGKVVDIRFVDVHRVTAYLSIYLTGSKVEKTVLHLALRARIFTTSRTITLWPKRNDKNGWWLRRLNFAHFYDAVPSRSNEKFEEDEELKRFGLQAVVSFEGPPVQEAIGNRDPISVLKAAIPVWKAEAF